MLELQNISRLHIRSLNFSFAGTEAERDCAMDPSRVLKFLLQARTCVHELGGDHEQGPAGFHAPGSRRGSSARGCLTGEVPSGRKSQEELTLLTREC